MSEIHSSGTSNGVNGFEIAIIGMAGRFPGAQNVEEFWQNLRDGVESITRFSDANLVAAGVNPAVLNDPNYIKAWSVLADAELFDASFFGFTPREAEITDPQHRLFLECAWEAIENAGYDPQQFDGSIGVYAGASMNTYLLYNLQVNGDLLRSETGLQMIIGNDKDYLATRVSYKLDLSGPSVSVQTSCSTSLVAVHLACRSLLGGECDMALAGGVTLRVPQTAGYLYQEGHILSADGQCRAFDARAQGTVWGSGVGIVVLKRLEDALAEGDCIRAVIKGTAINNDGAFKIGYTAPSIDGQARMIAQALTVAEISPETISYIEAHGTGTPLGDPIEIAALTQAFRAQTDRQGFCAVGSAKTNIGHLGAAAGVTGLIKTVLALEHKEIPPSLNFEQPNPQIDFTNSPFRVQTTLSEWNAGMAPRRAGISSFGMGGTNAHVIVEEAPEREPAGSSRPWKLLVLSAKTRSALEQATKNIVIHLKKTPGLDLADVAHTLQAGRKGFSHRRILVCSDVGPAVAALETLDPKHVFTNVQNSGTRSVVFMFPGQGTQYVNMGRELYENEATFREQVDHCAELLKGNLRLDLRDLLYPSEAARESAMRQMNRTAIAQPALFVIEYALAKLWMEWGIHPEAMIGHSVGEYVAACLAGVLATEDALTLLAARGRLVETLPGGAMLAVPLPQQEIHELLCDGLCLAAVNTPSLCVVSGPMDAVEKLENQLADKDIQCRRLETSHAFHSHMMEPVLELFIDEVRKVDLAPPKIPYVSNVTGTWITAAEATSPDYWAGHLRLMVRFAEGLDTLSKECGRILLEVGPGRTLSSAARRQQSKISGQVVVASLPPHHEPDSAMAFLLNSLGQLWLDGLEVDWAGFSARERRQRVPLPTYPFERQRYWIEPKQKQRDAEACQTTQVDHLVTSVLEGAQPEAENDLVAPRTPLESLIANIWQEVLGLEVISIDDDFFKLGGHSLLASQVMTRLRKALDLELPLNKLFETPTVANQSAYIGTIRGVALQTFLQEKNDAVRSHLRPVPSLSRAGARPLSLAQERLWFLDQLAPGNIAYNVVAAFRLKGQLNRIALEKSLNEIVRRHEVLRTTFSIVDERPVQVVSSSLSLALTVVEIGDHPETEREAEARRLVAEEAQRPFDLVRGPLLRVRLLRLDDRDHFFLVTMHHIVSDGWSKGVFFSELAVLYGAFSVEKPSPLRELPIQYADYAVWQRDRLQGEILEKQLSYWNKHLQGVATLQLTTDHPRPAVQSYRGASQSLVLSTELRSGLKDLSRNERATLFMTLLAAFQTLLHRYTGQGDIAVGSPIANRPRVEIEPLIGFFVNTLVMRGDLSGDPTFKELLVRIRAIALAAYAHQDVPFEKLVEELHPERNLGHSPLFQVAFALQNAPSRPMELLGLTVEPVERADAGAKFDLFLSVADEPQGLRATMEYSTDLFAAATISRLLGHFQILLQGIVADPNRRLSELPILTEAEKYQLLLEWNDTGKDDTQNRCIHELFEAQVEKTPDAIAVVFENQELTYRKLNIKASQLAQVLRKHGVGPETLVGICVERSLEMIIGLLGILKAGGGYVPLDPSYPRERLAFMLTETRANLLLTQERFVEGLPEKIVPIFCLDRNWQDTEWQGDDQVSVPTTDNIAYVIYTSGSTGHPKGVAVEHRQLNNYLLGVHDRLNLPMNATFATVSTLAADLGNTIIFSCLCTGGSLHVISEDRIADSNAMAEYFSRHTIDCLKIVPSHLAALQKTSHPEAVLPRRLLIVGGEASNSQWIKDIQGMAPHCAVMNHYGPTEATIGVLTHRVDQDTQPAQSSTLPLGRPIANTQIYLLDGNRNLVPVGVPGELHIGGLGLARGYFNRPELTAEKFVPNPFSDQPGARLYKTGDQARYLPDGNIEFLGRTDHQVKIRGYRIEPGEIEAALKQHPDVRESVVAVREDEPGDKRLIAYVIPRPDRAPQVNGKPRYRLPNGAAVVQLNKNETDYIYQEIFERQAYLRHGITIKDGDCIFDVGANIGLFTLFAHQIAKRPRLYSFEPNPEAYEILSANATLYGPEVRLFNCGLSNEAKTATFTFFPGFSLLSGFYADAAAEKQVVKSFMINQQKEGISEMAELVREADDILDERFASQTFTAQLKTLSGIIAQENIECIDLLKINAEKSELDVLLGIKESDWQKIRQIVLEVDVKDNLPTIASLLQRHGYELAVEQDLLLENTQLCYIYAIRPSVERMLLKDQRDGAYIRQIPLLKDPFLSIDELRNFLVQKIPGYMVPSAFVFLDSLPLTPNGKVDRSALPIPDQSRPELEENLPIPRTAIEELLAGIWGEVLELDKVGIHDNFFDLGGHSLLVTQVVSRVRQAFQEELPLRSLFENPTVARLAELIGSLRGGEARIRALPIVAGPTDQEYPLSFSQERFWFLDKLEPDNLAYKVTLGFRLSGPLNIEALEQALSEIVRRHEPLRTTVQSSNGNLVQRIADVGSIQLSIIDLTQEPFVDRDLEVQRLFDNERRRPFDLSSDLLLRATLMRLSTAEYVLIIGSHHVAWDHWCIELFFRELSILYRAFAAGKSSPLLNLPIQYKDYALWQRNIFQGAALEKHLAYWKEQLVNASPSLNLPTDHPRKPLHNRPGARDTLVISKELESALRSLSRKANVTFFMTLLAAFQTLLHRITGDDDIVVGTPVAGRDRSETESLIGLFLNSLALRTNLSGNPTFIELLTKVREVALGAYDHQELPFEKLVEELQPQRDLSKTPIFQVFINMYNFKEAGLELDGLTVRPLKNPDEVAPQFDLEFYIRQYDDGIHLIFVYDSDLFESTTIARLLGHFQVLLEGIVSHPEQRLSDLPILTEAERRQLLVEWNDTRRNYPRDKCVHQLFEEQAKRTPEAVAAVFEDQELTYEHLNGRANQLAHCLQALGVGPGTLVGICVERSLQMVVGLLAVLKAGGAYVPLDPTYPKERLAIMLDGAVAVLLTQHALLDLLPDHQARVVCLDTDWETIERESHGQPVNEVTSDNLAYVIFTSGSTGKPKGVEISHRALVNFLHSMREEPGLTAQDTLLSVTTLSFDIAALEIFLPITVGARVVIISREIASDGLLLAAKLAQYAATIMQATPATWRLLLEAGWQGNKQLTMLCGGEALPPELAGPLMAKGSSVWNLYGPTETTIWSALCRVDSKDRISIGHPIANTQIYILDSHLQPVPIGVPGDLYISGDGVARGYLNRPDLTKERFIANPFSDEPGARLYKTGDLARYFPDGNIEFLGRMDGQVKIRGFRIELGEIENVLAQVPGVREAVVLAREDTPGEKRLVAYVVPDRELLLPTGAIRTFLQKKLPEYMVPSAFVGLEGLPLTPNGKLHRQALPLPDQSEESFVAPRTSIETSLARIWAQMLKRERVGIHDNFFYIGGHSLLATQVISRIRSAFQIEISLRALFEKPTVEELAIAIAETQAEQTHGEGTISRLGRVGISI